MCEKKYLHCGFKRQEHLRVLTLHCRLNKDNCASNAWRGQWRTSCCAVKIAGHTFAQAISKSSWVTCTRRSLNANMPASVQAAFISAPDAPGILSATCIVVQQPSTSRDEVGQAVITLLRHTMAAHMQNGLHQQHIKAHTLRRSIPRIRFICKRRQPHCSAAVILLRWVKCSCVCTSSDLHMDVPCASGSSGCQSASSRWGWEIQFCGRCVRAAAALGPGCRFCWWPSVPAGATRSRVVRQVSKHGPARTCTRLLLHTLHAAMLQPSERSGRPGLCAP